MEESISLPLPPDPNDSTTAWPPLSSAPSRHLSGLAPPSAGLKALAGVLVMVSLNMVALVANTAVLVVLIKAPQLRKFSFVCHLCAVDLLCAVLLMPLGLVSTSPYFVGVVLTVLECRVFIFLHVFLIAVSIFTITAISVERYYYIVHPMRYEVKMTLKLTAVVMVTVWTAAGMLGLSTVFLWPLSSGRSCVSATSCSLRWSHAQHRQVFSVLFVVACFCLPAAVIFLVYCSVYKVARVAALQLRPLPSWPAAGQLKQHSDSINSQNTIITTTRSAPHRTARERPFGGGKAALTLVVIVGQFLVCWLPYFAVHLHLTLEAPEEAPQDLPEAVTWLAYSSFAVNPFFYGLLNRQIRKELWKLRRCYVGRRVEFVCAAASIPEGSAHENFLQFLHRTSCTAEPCSSLRPTVVQSAVYIPGQIPEEIC